MTQVISNRFWKAEARSEETKQFIRDIKRITRRKFTTEEKIRIIIESSRLHLLTGASLQCTLKQAHLKAVKQY